MNLQIKEHQKSNCEKLLDIEVAVETNHSNGNKECLKELSTQSDAIKHQGRGLLNIHFEAPEKEIMPLFASKIKVMKTIISKNMIFILATLFMFTVSACGPEVDMSKLSYGHYRLPYANGTDVDIWQDHNSHSGSRPKLDMAGVNGVGPYRIVAAQSGIIKIISDANTVNCSCNGGTCANNYVWIAHSNGEWTKYSHLATGSVRGDAGLSENDFVPIGTFLGFESDIGRACGTHLHFEVAIPNDPNNPLSNVDGGFIDGENLIPVFCPGVFVAEKDEVYTATACSKEESEICLYSKGEPQLSNSACARGQKGDACVQQLGPGANPNIASSYNKGVDFTANTIRLEVQWCPNADCDLEGTEIGGPVQVVILREGGLDPIDFKLFCADGNRTYVKTISSVEKITFSSTNLSGTSGECISSYSHSFARWEICETEPTFTMQIAPH